MKAALSTQLGQQLHLTPQLLQSIRLLQLDGLHLEQEIQRLLDSNPLLEIEDFYKAERFFTRFGGLAVLLGRCVPLVRSFISVPAGIERMPLFKFSLYTVIGSAVWNTIWIGLGYVFGPAIEPVLARWSGVISNVVVVIIGLLVLWFILARVYKRTKARRADGTSA